MEEQKSKKKRRKFDASFKIEAVKMIMSGRSVSEVSQLLGVGENILYKWKSEHFSSQETEDQSLILENERLRRQLRQVEMERDILKKAAAILAPKLY